jgi:dipeptidyl aminopeptidase/acylaminoacyl peptidase
MTARSDFNVVISDWLEDQAGCGAPDYLDDVLARTTRTRQRPAWSSLERWLPVQTTLRFTPVPRIAWLLVVIALLVAIGVAALAVGSRQHPLPPPFGPAGNGSVVFGGTDNDIHRLDPFSGATAALITGSTSDRNPSMAPDGTRFLFLRDSTVSGADGNFEPIVMVANADGSDPRPLTGPLANFDTDAWSRSAEWSHDGSRIAVASDVDGKPAVVVFTIDGSRKPIVVDMRGMRAVFMSFRPGDRELTFLGDKGDSTGLYAVGADGQGFRTILDPSGDYASLSPDGTKLAYQGVGASPSTFGAIHVVDVATGVETIPAFAPATTSADDNPSWSPDGTRLLFQRYRSGTYRMAVAPAAGGAVVEIGPVRAMNGGERVGAQFSPDGLHVMAHYDGDKSTWLMDVTGANDGTKLSSGIAETATWQRLAIVP